MPFIEDVASNWIASLLTDASKLFFGEICNAHEEFKELQKALERIHAKNDGLSYTFMPSDWLDELTRCHYEAEDIIDGINLAIMKKTSIRRMLPTNLNRIRELRTKMEDIEKAMETELSNRQTNLDQASTGGSRRSPHALPAHQFLRLEDKETIIEKLKSHPFGVSIIGMCGVGKSTLAQAIVDDVSIKEHFPHILSPRTSPNFNSKEVVRHLNLEKLHTDTRVLILLDDLHTVTPEDWHYFRSQCQEKLNSETKVIVTTRNPRVADVTGSSKYNLPTLSDEHCFQLILNSAQHNANLSDLDIEAILYNKVELVDKCKGLPLLANHIGLLLSSAAPGDRMETISKITTTSLWKLREFGRVLLSLTSVSRVLRTHLKRCLAYCTLFPPDHNFKKENLVQLWMAEGFTPVQSATEDARYLEQTTSEYFDDLLSYSIFCPSKLPTDEEPSYKMSELLHDLAQDVASKTFCRIHIGKATPIPSSKSIEFSDIRHFSLSCENIENTEQIVLELLSDIKGCKGLRTFLLLHDAGEKIYKNPTFFESLECLRVLDLSHANVTKLSNISKLEHLRYLDLSNTPIKKLPSLSKSTALQILKLNCCDNLRCLPSDLLKLTNLVCLEVNIKGLGTMPPSIGSLTNLQNLDVFIVGNDKVYKIGELEYMNDLRRSLSITKLENVKDKSEAQEAKLQNKKKLERLELQWSSSTTDEDAKQVLEGLQPPKNLKELTIRNYCGSEFPQWLSTAEVCGMLVTIHLDHCEVCSVLPSLGQLPMLKTLRVDAMYELIQVGHEFFGEACTSDQPQGFPSLELLVLRDLPILAQWTELGTSYMPRLRDLQIEKCQSLVTLPKMDHLTSLETLQILGCTKLRELPMLPPSLKSLIIKDSDIFQQQLQVGPPDWNKFNGIRVLIDSELFDTSEHLPILDWVVSHPSSSNQIPNLVEDSPAVTDSDARELAEQHPHTSSEMDTHGSGHLEAGEQLPLEMAALESVGRQMSQQHPPPLLEMNDVLQASEQHPLEMAAPESDGLQMSKQHSLTLLEMNAQERDVLQVSEQLPLEMAAPKSDGLQMSQQHPPPLLEMNAQERDALQGEIPQHHCPESQPQIQICPSKRKRLKP